MNTRLDVVARVRGSFVGSISGAVSIAAHGLGGGGLPPDESAIVLLLAACAAVGALISAIRIASHEWIFVVAALTAGQLIGHTTLASVSGHSHGLGLSAPMIAAHIAAIVASAVLVRSAECACLAVLSALSRIILAVLSTPRVDTGTWTSIPVSRATLSLWLLVSAACGTRAPPAGLPA